VIPRALRLSLAASIATTLGLVSASSMADMDQCVDANAKAQELRRDGKLSAAREQLRQCASPSCPAMVRDDCTKRLDEVENAQPTIAFEVKDASGADMIAVNVTVDGRPLVNKLDGTALPIDRGAHVFTFEVAGQPPVTRTFMLTEGEKGRRERIVLGGTVSPAPLAAPEANAPPPPPPSPLTNGPAVTEPASTGGGMGTQKILGVVAAGVGVAGIAVGGVFGAMTLAEKSQQTTDCPNASCGSAGHALALTDHSTGMTDSTISTVGFIAGGALLVGGAILFFTGRHSSERSATTGMLLVPSVAPGGGGLFLRGEF
jgi:hypothetical protein